MRNGSLYRFDVTRFINDIHARFTERPTLARLSSESGVSEITFSRMNHGFQPSMDVFMELCGVFELEPGAYFVTRTVPRRRRNGNHHKAAL